MTKAIPKKIAKPSLLNLLILIVGSICALVALYFWRSADLARALRTTCLDVPVNLANEGRNRFDFRVEISGTYNVYLEFGEGSMSTIDQETILTSSHCQIESLGHRGEAELYHVEKKGVEKMPGSRSYRLHLGSTRILENGGDYALTFWTSGQVRARQPNPRLIVEATGKPAMAPQAAFDANRFQAKAMAVLAVAFALWWLARTISVRGGR